MPGYAAGCREGSELVDNVPGEEVDIIISQGDPGILHTIPVQLVQFRLFQPVEALGRERDYPTW